MADSVKRIIVGTAGYWHRYNPLVTPEGAITSPSRNMVFRNEGVLESFPGFTRLTTDGDERAFAIEDGYAYMALGNVIESYGKSLIFAGGGTLKAFVPSVNASLLTIGAAASIPQIAVLNGTGNGYLAPRQMGLSPQASAPLLSEPSALGTGFSGKITGSVSARLGRQRDETGAVSITGPVSNVIEVTAKSVLVNIPTAPSDGSSTWILYFTGHGDGSIGNHLQFPVKITEAQVAAGTVNGSYGNAVVRSTGVSRQVEVEYEDADLLPVKPINDAFPAESCSFVEKLGNHTILIGTHRGLGVWASHGDAPEAFSPLDVVFLPEPVIGISKPHDEFLWVLCKNSIHIVLLTGAVEGPPITLRTVLNKKGVSNPLAYVSVGDELYVMSSGGIPFRINAGGAYDEEFSIPIRGFFDSVQHLTICGYDELSNSVLYCVGQYIACFHRDSNRWSAPIDILTCNGSIPTVPGTTVQAIFTQNGRARVIFRDASNYSQWLFDEGNGSQWIIQTSDNHFDEPLIWKDIVGGRLYYDASAGNGVISSVSFTGFNQTVVLVNFVGASPLPNSVSGYIPMNVRDFITTRLRVEGSGKAFRLFGCEVQLVYHGGVR